MAHKAEYYSGGKVRAKETVFLAFRVRALDRADINDWIDVDMKKGLSKSVSRKMKPVNLSYRESLHDQLRSMKELK
jgi:hypothetical protein